MNRNDLILDTCRGYSLVARKIEGKDPCVIFLGVFVRTWRGPKPNISLTGVKKTGDLSCDLTTLDMAFRWSIRGGLHRSVDAGCA